MENFAKLCLNCMDDMDDQMFCAHCGATPGSIARSSLALPEKNVLNGRFVVGRVLGQPGGFGITYLVWDKVLETTAAIKEFLPISSVSREAGTVSVLPNSEQDAASFKKGLRIFMKEAKTLAQFSHPNIVRIRDCFPANNTAYLVMDYHRGQPLDQIVKCEGGPLSESLALAIMLPILDGLKAIHDKQFLHRDIKPQNIYVTDQGTPMLLDFGAARMAMVDATKTMTVMLSAGFAPFEQYHTKGRQGPWSDIYACAATLYFLVTGKVPGDAIERRHDDRLLPPTVLNPALSKGFGAAIMRGLALEPTARPQTVEAFRDALSGTAHPAGTSTAATERLTSVSDALRASPTKPLATPVILHRQPAKAGSGSSRWIWLTLLFAVAAFAWNRLQPLVPTGDETAAKPPVAAPPPVPPVVGPAIQRAAPDPASLARTPVVFEEPRTDPIPLPPRAARGSREETSTPTAIGAKPLPERPFDAAPRNGRRPVPPRRAFEVCRGKPIDGICNIRGLRGRESGRCELFGLDDLACVPDSHRERRVMAPPDRLPRF